MEKPKIPWDIAFKEAEKLSATLEPFAKQLAIAGSLRRCKSTVGDIEIVYIPKSGVYHRTGELFPTEFQDLVEVKVEEMLKSGTLAYRPKSDGSNVFGPKVKLLLITNPVIPLDLFSATEESWANTLMSRTGGKENNILIASTALRQGLEWLPSGSGFREKRTGRIIPVKTEQQIYSVLGLKYISPEERL